MDKSQLLKDTLDGMLKQCAAEANDWSGVYRDGRNYVYSNQLADKEIKEGWPRVQRNRIFPAVIQEQSLLTQRRVTIKASPFEPSDADGAKTWQPVLQWQYATGLDVPGKAIKGICDAKTHGHWVSRLYWDPRGKWDRKANRWTGELKMRMCRPELVTLDPDSEDPDDPEWAVEFEQVRVDEGTVRYPGFKNKFELEASGKEGGVARVLEQMMDAGSTGGPLVDEQGLGMPVTSEGRLAGLLTPLGPTDETDADALPGVGRKVWLTHFFFKDRTTERMTVVDHEYTGEELLTSGRATLELPEGEEEEVPGPNYVDTMTGEPLTKVNWPQDERDEDIPKYPGWRYVVRLGEDTILTDESWDYDNPPYAVGQNLPLPHTWHGLNGVELARHTQDTLNDIGKHFGNWINLFSDPVVEVERGALEGDPDNRDPASHLRAKAGAVWDLAVGAIAANRIRRTPPPPMPSSSLAIDAIFDQQSQDETGVHEIALGRKTSSSTTATEALALETNTKLRTAMQWKMMETWILRVMRRAQELCDRNMKPGDMVRIAGTQAQGLVAKLKESDFNARFDLSLEVVTNLPFDRDLRKNDAKELYQILGAPYLSDLLDAYEVPDKEVLLSKVEAYQAILASQQALSDEVNQAAEQWKQASSGKMRIVETGIE